MKDRLLRVLPSAANDDGEFAIAARMWETDIVFASGDDAVRFVVQQGRVSEVASCAADAAAEIRIVGPADGWEKILRAVPPPFYQDLFGAALHHGFAIQGKIESIYPYYPALRRLIELLRADGRQEGR